jgi:hypothetical protein
LGDDFVNLLAGQWPVTAYVWDTCVRYMNFFFREHVWDTWIVHLSCLTQCIVGLF